jgi:phosphoribosylformylglycinamidine synthase II
MRSEIVKKVSANVFAFDLSIATDEELAEIKRLLGLGLSIDELKYIRNHVKRPLTDVELQTIAQTWSEHCYHRTFKGDVITNKGVIKNLLKSYIMKATKELNKPWCFSVFKDNAGLVEFDKNYLIAAKVETHNHPSAIEPFGGAATGIGGVIRDILGVWGEPIALLDVLCFGPLDLKPEELPAYVRHPKYLYEGVVAGIGSYGNNMGIPTVCGAIVFDKGYIGNIVVYCGCVGILPKKAYIQKVKKGDLIVIAGGRTGKDGVRGAIFASADLSEELEELRTAVQIPDPIEEEKLRRAILRIRDEKIASGITDLGGGGLSSAVGEMAHRFGLGAEVELSYVHLKLDKMVPWEIWISESQERMLLSVPKNNLSRVFEIFEEEDVEVSVIGSFTKTNKLVVNYCGERVCDLSLNFLFSPPKVIRKASFEPPEEIECRLEEPENLEDELLLVLSEPNVKSKEEVIRSYDHEVRGCTVVKPIHGYTGGPNDAAVIKPLKDSWRGIVISVGINPFYSDPYWMVASSIEEALRNNRAVGGRRIALLDNFVWGNPEYEDRMGSLVRAIEACYDFSKAFDTPFISGKDSLYNESPLGPIRPTFLATGIGIINDIRKAITTELKRSEDPLYILGYTKEELGGSAYLRVKGRENEGKIPKVNSIISKKIMEKLTKAIDKGLVLACHDISDGGIGAAAAEMVISSMEFGLSIDLRSVPSDTNRSDFLLFSESQSRFLVEVKREKTKEFEKIFKGLPFNKIGKVTSKKAFIFIDLRGRVHEISSSEIKKAWAGMT